MSARRDRPAAKVLAACALGLAVGVPQAGAHGQVDPSYLLKISAVTPRVAGLEISVLERDRLDLHNRTGRTVTVFGRAGEPYVRVLADGSVEANARSPLLYINENQPVPGAARATTARTRPRWLSVARTGRFFWHDSRTVWLRRTRPPQVIDPTLRTVIFPWRVPIAVGGRRGEVRGSLLWSPTVTTEGSTPAGVIAGGVVLLVLALVSIFALRQRRRTPSPSG